MLWFRFLNHLRLFLSSATNQCIPDKNDPEKSVRVDGYQERFPVTTAYLSVEVGIVGSIKDNDKRQVEKITPRKTHAEVQQKVATSLSPKRRKKKPTSSDEESSGSESSSSSSSSSASSSSESESDSDSSLSTITESTKKSKSSKSSKGKPDDKGGNYLLGMGGMFRRNTQDPDGDEPEVIEEVSEAFVIATLSLLR